MFFKTAVSIVIWIGVAVSYPNRETKFVGNMGQISLSETCSVACSPHPLEATQSFVSSRIRQGSICTKFVPSCISESSEGWNCNCIPKTRTCDCFLLAIGYHTASLDADATGKFLDPVTCGSFDIWFYILRPSSLYLEEGTSSRTISHMNTFHHNPLPSTIHILSKPTNDLASAGFPGQVTTSPINLISLTKPTSTAVSVQPLTVTQSSQIAARPSGNCPTYFFYGYEGGSSGTNYYPLLAYNASDGSVNPCTVIPNWSSTSVTRIKTMPERISGVRVFDDSTCNYTAAGSGGIAADGDKIGFLSCSDFKRATCYKQSGVKGCGAGSLQLLSTCDWN